MRRGLRPPTAPASPARPQTVHDGRIYTLKIYCDEQYPDRVSECRSSARGRRSLLATGASPAERLVDAPLFCLRLPVVRPL
jgi:hypothetical protein